MSYYFNKTLKEKSFEEALNQVTAELKKQGFGVVTELDISKTLKSKINVDFKKYIIIGACSPHHAYTALKHEDKIGVFLPCNIVVEEHKNGEIEVSAVDPIASMSAVKNEALGELAVEMQQKMQLVIENLD